MVLKPMRAKDADRMLAAMKPVRGHRWSRVDWDTNQEEAAILYERRSSEIRLQVSVPVIRYCQGPGGWRGAQQRARRALVQVVQKLDVQMILQGLGVERD